MLFAYLLGIASAYIFSVAIALIWVALFRNTVI
jgi:hypothetical protein